MSYEIWHNPRCSKSRATLEMLQDAGVSIRVRRYLDEPPSAAEIDAVLRRLGLEPEAITRMADARSAGVVLESDNREAWIAELAARPALIERPIVVSDDGRAAIGRPPENVRVILP